jgi:hypothetical protein
MRIQVQIPLKPHINKYVMAHLRPQDGVLSLSAKSALGLFFLTMVQRGRSDKRKLYVGHSCLVVSLPARVNGGGLIDARSEHHYVSEANVQRINRFLEFVMKRELFTRLDVLHERGETKRKSGKMKEEIENWLMKYGIDECDLTFESVKKSYQRYRASGKSLVESMVS